MWKQWYTCIYYVHVCRHKTLSHDPEIQRLPFAVLFVTFMLTGYGRTFLFVFISFAEKAVRKLRTLKGISYNYKRQQSSFFKHSNLYLIPVKFWCEIIASVFVIQNVWIPGQLSVPLWMHRAGRSKKCGRLYRVRDSGK